MDAHSQQLWLEYVQAEQDRIRAVTVPALDRFVEAITHLDEASQHDWALQLAEDVVDRGADTPIRFLLFEKVLLPALVIGVTHERAGCARWLAHFESLLFHSKSVGLPDHLKSPIALLREAIRVDPSDRRARQGYVQRLAADLEYSIHELPSGVLYGHNGATVAQCDELLQDLADFREHVEFLQEAARFADLIEDCSLHFHRYRDYLASGRPGGSYELFLTAPGEVVSK